MKSPDERLPPKEIKRIWDDAEELEQWTNEQLGPRFDIGEIELGERNMAILAGMHTIKDAIAQGYDDIVLRLIADDEVLRRYAIRLLMHKLPDIRERLPYDLKERLQAAVMEVDRIREIWWRKLGKRYRGDRQPPTAIQIAARRWDVSEQQLLSHMRNRARDELPWFVDFWRHRYSVY
jgi:hypothetical protein